MGGKLGMGGKSEWAERAEKSEWAVNRNGRKNRLGGKSEWAEWAELSAENSEWVEFADFWIMVQD